MTDKDFIAIALGAAYRRGSRDHSIHQNGPAREALCVTELSDIIAKWEACTPQTVAEP